MNDKDEKIRPPYDQHDLLRSEAQKIVCEAREELEKFRAQTLEAIQNERLSLEATRVSLETSRKELDADASVLERRRRELEREAFEDARKNGFNAGLEEGRKEGIRVGKEELTALVEQKAGEEVERRLSDLRTAAIAPIHKLVQEMLGSRKELLKNWEENILQISAAIAYQTIMREPTLLRNAPLDLLREALELAVNCATLKIRMNPRDVSNLGDAIKSILEETGSLAKSEVVSDPKISVGGCVVETSLGVVDERLESRLERIVSELSE